jgi:two-component system nitrogen regulation response regulator GlnG
VGVAALVHQLLSSGSGDIYRRVIQEVDRVVLSEVLRHVRGNQVHASELLGISRTTLRAKLATMPDIAPNRAGQDGDGRG